MFLYLFGLHNIFCLTCKRAWSSLPLKACTSSLRVFVMCMYICTAVFHCTSVGEKCMYAGLCLVSFPTYWEQELNTQLLNQATHTLSFSVLNIFSYTRAIKPHCCLSPVPPFISLQTDQISLFLHPKASSCGLTHKIPLYEGKLQVWRDQLRKRLR